MMMSVAHYEMNNTTIDTWGSYEEDVEFMRKESADSYISSGHEVLKDSQDLDENSNSPRHDSEAFLKKYSELVKSYDK